MKKALFTLTAAVLTIAVLFSAASCGLPLLLKNRSKDEGTGTGTEAVVTVPATTEAAPETVPETVTEAVTEAQTEAVTAPYVPTDEEIYEVYKAAVGKTNALSDVKYNNYTDLNMKMIFAGASVDMHTVKDQKFYVSGRGGDTPMFESHTNKTVESGEKTSESTEDIYIDADSIYYRTDVASKYTAISRASVDPEVLNEYLSDANTGLNEMPPEVFTGATMIKGTNGKVYISAHPSNSTADTVYGNVVEQMKTFFDEMEAKILTLTTKGSSMSFVISPDGYLVTVEISVDMLMLIEYSGVTGTVNIDGKSKATVVDPGSTVVITVPEEIMAPEDQIYAEYKNAVDKVNGCSDIYTELLMSQSMVMSVGTHNSTTVVTNKTEMLCHDRYGSDPVIEVHTSQKTDSDGETEETLYDLFADKNNVYIRTDPDSAYIVLSRENAQALAFGDSIDPDASTTDPLEPEALYGAVISENEDGSKTITAHPDDDTINAVFYGYIETMTESFANMGAENITHDITSAEILITLNSEGYMENETAKMTIDFYLSLYGSSVKVSIEACITHSNINPGREVTILIPET